MNLEFDEIRFDGIGKQAGRRDLTWANLSLFFKDTETDHVVSTHLNLLLTKHPDKTISEFEKEAGVCAKTILSAALSALEEYDVRSLIENRDKRMEAENSRIGLS